MMGKDEMDTVFDGVVGRITPLTPYGNETFMPDTIKPPEIVCELVHPNARIPEKSRNTDSGYDVFACEDAIIRHGEVAKIPLGIRLELPEGYEIQVRARSGMAWNHGIGIVNGIGTIDEEYRGLLYAMLTKNTDGDYCVTTGDRVAQLVLAKVEKSCISSGKVNTDTSRGTGGFGHTGK